MTVIAASVAEGRMCADKWCFDGDVHFPMRKIHRIGGKLYGFAGDVVDINSAIAHFRTGKGRPSGNVTALILSDVLMSWTPLDGMVRIDRGWHAIGSGGACAMAAMHAGADVKRATSIACEVDARCGGGVSTYRLG